MNLITQRVYEVPSILKTCGITNLSLEIRVKMSNESETQTDGELVVVVTEGDASYCI